MPVDQRILVNVVVAIAAICGLLLSILALLLNAFLARPLKSSVVQQRNAIEALEVADHRRRKHHHFRSVRPVPPPAFQKSSVGSSPIPSPHPSPHPLIISTTQPTFSDAPSPEFSTSASRPPLVSSPLADTEERRDSVPDIPHSAAGDSTTFSSTSDSTDGSRGSLSRGPLCRKLSGCSSRSHLHHCILGRSLTSPSRTSFRSQPCLVPEPSSSPKRSIFHRRSTSSLDGTSSKRKTLLLKKNKSPPPPPQRTLPYTAPYFFPVPGSPEAVGYARKTRENQIALSHEMPITHTSPLASVVQGRHTK